MTAPTRRDGPAFASRKPDAAVIAALLAFLTVGVSPARAADYYVTPTGGGDGTGSSDANALSYAALFSKPLARGDRVRFKAGHVYAGQHWAKDGVKYDKYGPGPNPIISGFTTLSDWTHSGDGIYYAALQGSRHHGVTLDGVVQGIGRYPDSGYLTYTATNAVHDDPATPDKEFVLATEISGETVGEIPFDAVGAEVCIRKYRWVIDRHVVAGHADDTLRFTSTRFHGNNSAYNPHAGNGYFIQNHLSTLDHEGEWWFDAAEGRLYMHFGEGTPERREVRVSTLDQVVPLNSAADIVFNDIDFEGGNIAIANHGSKNITLTNCNFRQQGDSAIYGTDAAGFAMKGGSISDALNNAIAFPIGASDITIDGVTVSRSGVIAGAGYSGDGGYSGIFIVGAGITVRNCVVTDTGYNAIHFNGNDALIEENHVSRFCTVKDDGGGIYTYLGSDAAGSNQVIRRNVVLNAVGAYAGSESFDYEPYGKAVAIYLDGYSNHVIVDGNVAAHGEWGGIFLNGNSHNSITHNLVYDFASQLLLNAHTSAGMLRDVTVTDNLYIARTREQNTLEVNLHVSDDIGKFGAFDRNCYARPVSEGATIRINRAHPGGEGVSHIDLAAWKSAFKLDPGSTVSAVAADSPEDLRLEFATSKAESIPLTGLWKDVLGTAFGEYLLLEKYSGKVIVRAAATRPAPRPQ